LYQKETPYGRSNLAKPKIGFSPRDAVYQPSLNNIASSSHKDSGNIALPKLVIKNQASLNEVKQKNYFTAAH